MNERTYGRLRVNYWADGEIRELWYDGSLVVDESSMFFEDEKKSIFRRLLGRA